MTQLALELAAPARTRRAKARAPRRAIGDRFAEFHAANPDVYAELVRLAREAKAAGRQRVGMKELWEVARWQLRLRSRGDAYALDNSFTAPMARLIQDQEPDLAGLFETRKRKAA
jgi:hypothetical protein